MGGLGALVRWYFGQPAFAGPLLCFVVGAAIGWLVEWQGVDSDDYADNDPSLSNRPERRKHFSGRDASC